MLMDRNRAVELGHETLRILERGCYTNPAGQLVDIGELVSRAVERTVSYPPESEIPLPRACTQPTQISVANETTLAAASRLVADGYSPAALNFASATHPGGGFLNGARAQEESLCRSSGLYACFRDHPMYEFHRRRGDAMYTDYVIDSPDVPVFRADDGTLLAKPYLCSFITCPAVNASALRQNDPSRLDRIGKVMWDRILKVLAVAAKHGHETLILGAWGCGAFGCDTEEIADLFAKALSTECNGVFRAIVFAITDWSPEKRFIGPFCKAFGQDFST